LLWLPKVALVVGAVPVVVAVYMVIFHNSTIRYLARRLGVHRSLFDSYSLRRKLFELFSDDRKEVPVPPGLPLVAAPVQKFENELGKQVWFEPGKTPLVDALLAALAIPGLFAPVKSKPDWIASLQEEELDLIEGYTTKSRPIGKIMFANNLAPQREELLQVAAAGCRETLETLHRNSLAGFGYQPVPCSKFLSQRPGKCRSGVPSPKQLARQVRRKVKIWALLFSSARRTRSTHRQINLIVSIR